MIDRRVFLSAMGVTSLDALLPAALHAIPLQANSTAKETRGIRFTRQSIEIDGRKQFLVAGEMHYFRAPKADWRRRMDLFRQAGGNCIATYIPWAVHEPQPGKFLFETGDGVHDLESFLQTASAAGLLVIARPGPFIGSELKRGGVPDWLIEGKPQILARSVDNKPLGDSVSYLHPDYLEKARLWYRQLCPIIAKHTVQNGGPVALLQLDNELTGAHIWHGSVDYNPEAMGFGKIGGRYPEFLRAHYGTVAVMNKAYGANFESFEAALPLSVDQCKTLADLRRAKDYFDFYLGTIAEYTKVLAYLAHQNGIAVPFAHNAGDPSMSPLFLETIRAQGNDFLLGTDSYYNLGQDRPDNPTAPASVDIFCALEMLRIMGYPPTVFELQGGSPYTWPPIQAGDCAAWYWMHLAYGMKGSSYYVFTGGPNPPGLGMTSDDYDYDAAISASGELRPLYAVQKDFGNFLKDNEWLAEAGREADLRVALDFDVPRSIHFWKQRDEQRMSNPEAWEFLRKGVLTSSFCAGLSPEFCDLRSDAWANDIDMPLLVPASSYMAAAKQQRIVRFLQNKGCALITPTLPAYDENFMPCTVLADFLGSPELRNNKLEAVRINIAGVHNIASNGNVFTTTRLPVGAEVLGVDEWSGGVVAWQLTTPGGGKAIFLGMSWNHGRREHQQLLSALLLRLGVRPRISCSNPAVWASLRTNGSRSALFLINLFSQPVEADVTCRPHARSSVVQLGRQHLAPMSVKFIEL